MEECSSWNYNASEEDNKPINEYITEENALGIEDLDPVSLNELMDCSRAFTTKEIFPTRDDLITWAKNIGREYGYGVVIIRSETGGGPGKRTIVTLGCERSGKYRIYNNNTPKEVVDKGVKTKKCGCPFKLKGRPLKNGAGWMVKVLCGFHNHSKDKTSVGHLYAGHLLGNEKSPVNVVKPKGILLTLKDHNESNVSTMKQIFNAHHKFQLCQKGNRTQMQHLKKILEDAKYMHWLRRDEITGVVRGIFWTYPNAIDLLNAFHVVLIIDNTFKTNKYHLPLLEIVGVTSTELTFSVAFIYMESEQADNYLWALQMMRDLIEKHDAFPQVIVTDSDNALMNAVQIVFPQSTHLLCRFHINKNVKAKCKMLVNCKDEQELVMSSWETIVDSPNEVEFERRLVTFKTVCTSFPVFVKHVEDTWLILHKEKFISAWTDKVMHLGNTSNRVEGAHKRLKNMLQNSTRDFCNCWDSMRNLIILQYDEIRSSFEKSIITVEHSLNTYFFIKLRGFVSRSAMRHILAEYDRVKHVGDDSSLCGCSLRTTHGLPCAHELASYNKMGHAVPLHVVHPHWRKLNVQGMIKKTCIHSFKQLCIGDAIEALWRRYNESDESGRITLTNKLLEILAENSECPSIEKVSSSSPTTLPATLHGFSFSTCTSSPGKRGCYTGNDKFQEEKKRKIGSSLDMLRTKNPDLSPQQCLDEEQLQDDCRHPITSHWKELVVKQEVQTHELVDLMTTEDTDDLVQDVPTTDEDVALDVLHVDVEEPVQDVPYIDKDVASDVPTVDAKELVQDPPSTNEATVPDHLVHGADEDAPPTEEEVALDHRGNGADEDAPLINEDAAHNASADEDDVIAPEAMILEDCVHPDDRLIDPFPGGPEDISVLPSFGGHTTVRVWRKEPDRALLKTVMHGGKMAKLPYHDAPPQVRAIVGRAGVDQLVGLRYHLADQALVAAFVERWHVDTNTFHLPVGEMTITLDDVASLMHLPVRGRFVSVPSLTSETAMPYLKDLLELDDASAQAEVQFCKGPHIRFRTLRYVYEAAVAAQHWDVAARACLLHILGCTLFADKSANSVRVEILELLRDLNIIGEISWGAICLTILFKEIGFACRHNAKQICGYLSLLLSWIWEHFPGFRQSARLNQDYTEDLPRAQRWITGRGGGQIRPLRLQLDQLRAQDVEWTPYASAREHHPLHPVAFFSGRLRFSATYEQHLPERVLRQFGHVQLIPRLPLRITHPRYSIIEVDTAWELIEKHILSEDDRGPHMEDMGAVWPNYMQWYHRISHPYMLPSSPKVIEPPIWRGDSSERRCYDPPSTFEEAMGRIGSMADEVREIFRQGLVEDNSDVGRRLRRIYTLSGRFWTTPGVYRRRLRDAAGPNRASQHRKI